MADADPARRWHAGPTTLADITDLSTPAEAPHTIRFPPAMTTLFRQQFGASFPGGHAREQGGTIVADRHGALSVQNIGGFGSTAGSFLPNIMLRDTARFRVVGVFHTHPYDHSEGGMTGVAFSGGDVGALVLTGTLMSAVQSGPRLFVYVRTALTPTYTDKDAEHRSANAELKMRVKAGQTFQQASRLIAQGRALRFGLAYYQGAHGVATRV